MIDNVFDRIARVIEVTLALAFIFAVLLNFGNVVGRYLFGISLLGSDEVQIFIMVGMTFLGAAVVTRRNLHLRMDVLVRFLPAPVRVALRVVELLLLATVAGFVVSQSYFYAGQMLRIGRTSDMAGVPMWIPHGTVALGFALILIVAVLGSRAHRATPALQRGQAMTFALAVVPVALLLLGFPIFLVLLTGVTVALVFFMHVPLAALHQNLFASVNAFALLAIPFFIYAGELMGRGSVAQRLVDVVQAGVGSIRGSLGVTAVGTSAIFGAISGASAATVATIGRVMVPAMRRAGYPETFTAGLITAVGAIDVIIPPSIPMIVYGAAAEESVARLYAAGVLPGLMIAAMLAAYVVWRARRENFGAGEPFQWRVFLRALGRSLWALGAPVIILGGIYGGVFSPTEAAAVACVYAAFVTAFVFRELGWRDIVEAAASTVLFTGQILIIVACAGVFAWLLTVNQVPAAMTAWLQSLNVSAWMLLLAINILLLLVGCFLDPLSAILLLSPLLVPLVKAAGIDGVHFGIVVTVNLAIGLFHPPFGINIFVAQSVLGLKLETIYRGIIPFVIIYLVALALITYIPDLSLIGVRYLLARG